MNVSLYQAAAAMNAQSRLQELVAENLVVSAVPGARKQEATFAATAAGYASGAPGASGNRFVIPTAVVATNFTQGQLSPSNSPLHFAIEGPGFFEIQLPNGDLAYTRKGQFHLDDQGYLVTQHGCQVMGDNGPMQLDRNNPGETAMTPEGLIRQGEDIKGRLRLVEFNDPHLLRPSAGGVFLTGDPQLLADEARASQVFQGSLEASNISPLMEMASLVTAMRMFESNQRVLQMQDERMGRVVAELGNPA